MLQKTVKLIMAGYLLTVAAEAATPHTYDLCELTY